MTSHEEQFDGGWDLYGEIASEFNVERNDVKTATLAYMYGAKTHGKYDSLKAMKNEMRKLVRMGIDVGWIKVKSDPFYSQHGNGD